MFKQFLCFFSVQKLLLYIIFLSACTAENFDFVLHKHTINNIIYLDIAEFIHSNDLKSTYFNSKEKLEIEINNTKVYLSPYSSFCKVNKKIYHLRHETIYHNKQMLVPATSFYQILQLNNLPYKISKIDNKKIHCFASQYDINHYNVFNKNNGILIQLESLQPYQMQDIATSQSNSGWFNITILNAIIDSIGLKNIPLQSPIKKLEVVQYQESAQLSFLLDIEIEDIDIEIQDKSIDIMLRTLIENNADKITEMREKWLIDTIVLDPGHGGKDPGAIGYNNLKEKTVTLDVAKKLGQMIERKLGINVIYTRENDVFIPLWERTKIANQADGKLFISLHANSSSKSSHITGFETYLLRSGKIDEAVDVAERENAVINMEKASHQYINFKDENYILASITQNSFMKESEKLAALIQQQLSKHINSRDRGVKQAGFHVLVGASMPNVLIEMGFLSNKKESKQLEKTKYRKLIASAIFKAIEEFIINNNKKLNND